ncbi:MAG: S-methyl-5'-thioadenosine phosphorylase [Methanobrevibacter sp.]|jgi:5'-methylthioadenosine phosphorylase|nr:S-methyl-5'-thioadenosine phosphorylase [Methanobrevibacter sp.]
MIGIIGGSGIYDLASEASNVERFVIKTPYGSTPEVSKFKIGENNVIFMPRHSKNHSVPPHKINYRANIYGLKSLGVNQIIATNAVGSLNLEMEPGSFVLCDDFIDFTSQREKTFFDNEVLHVDVTEPYCARLREAIMANTESISGKIFNGGVYVCNEGPRFETPAEIKFLEKIDGNLVGMTGLPEAVLAREKEMCYSSICTVSNYAASISPNKLTMDEVVEIMDIKKEELTELIYNTAESLVEPFDCPCLHGLEGA